VSENPFCLHERRRVNIFINETDHATMIRYLETSHMKGTAPTDPLPAQGHFNTTE